MMRLWFGAFLTLSPIAALARCVATPTYKATFKVVTCDERKPGQVFIRGEILESSNADNLRQRTSGPQKGRQYVFYEGLSPLVADGKGGTRERGRTACLALQHGLRLTAFLSEPCCDANYAYCGKRRVDFLLHRGDDPPDAR